MSQDTSDTAVSVSTEITAPTADAETPETTGPASTVPANANRAAPWPASFAQYIGSGWAERAAAFPPERHQSAFAAARRRRLSETYPGKRIVVAAGELKVRSNDTDYPFRAASAFSWLTGWASDSEPGAVLVLDPAGDGHIATLYFAPSAGRDTDEFYANPAIGEFWIGPRPTLEEVATDLGLATADLATLDRTDDDLVAGADSGLDRTLDEFRLVKDEYEIEQMRLAVAATARGFDDVVAELPTVQREARGERVVEGVFNTRARVDGNAVGYDTIAASGAHACILHWTRNDGPVLAGDLILIDAGVELDSLYTADITRTIPVDGRFTEVQRRVYEAVREAADAAFAIVRPGIRFADVHDEAMKVIAAKIAEWGFVDADAETLLASDDQRHRRYMVHGTSHHLGIDVHDCAKARRELYREGILEPGMVFTIEPGLYFQPDDLTVPEEYRGIGVRIEDDIVVTENGAENLSAGIPRTADDVERWIAGGSVV
ncbi:aminopeptidase P family protein [Amnibacterium flavum]|uniref:Xaa-Pro aminopeptidase n=1 Tax=Amnibacterium flavum TaxID=2173173 RepID=A0A2V1HQ81_9MICO|nr:aminopeptidase P family protein [Amnibacterium flavum]PVZ93782.1 Xaa-Pro aminopeptidase [Amnibacterium flavum]